MNRNELRVIELKQRTYAGFRRGREYFIRNDYADSGEKSREAAVLPPTSVLVFGRPISRRHVTGQFGVFTDWKLQDWSSHTRDQRTCASEYNTSMQQATSNPEPDAADLEVSPNYT